MLTSVHGWGIMPNIVNKPWLPVCDDSEDCDK